MSASHKNYFPPDLKHRDWLMESTIFRLKKIDSNLSTKIIDVGNNQKLLIVGRISEQALPKLSFLVNTEIAKKKIYEFYFLKFLKIISKFSFEILDLNKIYTETFDYREAHIKLLEKSGFNKESRLTSHYYKNNKFVDVIFHSKFR